MNAKIKQKVFNIIFPPITELHILMVMCIGIIYLFQTQIQVQFNINTVLFAIILLSAFLLFTKMILGKGSMHVSTKHIIAAAYYLIISHLGVQSVVNGNNPFNFSSPADTIVSFIIIRFISVNILRLIAVRFATKIKHSILIANFSNQQASHIQIAITLISIPLLYLAFAQSTPEKTAIITLCYIQIINEIISSPQ